MGDEKDKDATALTKARMELEALYESLPDESINLTFKHLTDIEVHRNSSSSSVSTEKSIRKDKKKKKSNPMSKIPSLDFNRGRQAAGISLHPQPHATDTNESQSQQIMNWKSHSHHIHMGQSPSPYQNVSPNSMHVHEIQMRRRRPGIPHSNICTNCTTYIYIFRHRCLVCGRVYCRECVRMGMGEMSEGRKCVEYCLGRRFSNRYITKAGDVGGCFGWSLRYPSFVKQAELEWAEKGPRRKGDKSMMSMSPINIISMNSHSHSQWAAATATSSDASTITGGSRFALMSSPYSPASAHRHHIPF